ncbi:MATE family efflux transporter [Amaricoccus solimangrovi]|uniref:MATE family efflux transporter n=1 Tax=Amaricoccus solimangrovi TaxID=2589815 RepID=A0A501WU59_9RHOB|nr:MATE family efflux transporter [Amaricoccus solimangrovi]TPE52948.1 MATE family efflux transporter [Amaricoccus solimangrovi]
MTILDDRAPLAAPRASLAARLPRHWSALFHLSWPVVLSRAGLVVLSLAAIVLAGRHDTLDLAHLSLGYAVFFPLVTTGVGALVGIISQTAREKGAGAADLTPIFRRGLRWAVLVGGALTLLLLLSEKALLLIGHEPAMAAAAGRVAVILAPGALFQTVFVAAGFYLEGTGRMKPGLVAMIAANLVNLLLCWLLIGGRSGLPALGAEGAAIAGTAARFVMAAGLLGWMARLPEFRAARDPGGLWGPGGWAAGAEMRRIGLAGGAAYCFETFAFATMAQAAGLLGASALAAYTIAHNVETIVFMMALGISVATAVRVGQTAGAGDVAEARAAGVAGVSASMGLIGLVGLGLYAIAPSVVGFFSNDPSLIARGAPLIGILAVSMIFDAGQVVLGQSTRALGDSWGTTLIFFIAFWCVMIPLGLVLAFHAGLAEAGLFIGTAAGCLTAAVLLSLRLRVLLARRGA